MTTTRMLAAASLAFLSMASQSFGKDDRPVLMTVHLNYKDSLNKYNRQKLYVARSRNKDVLVSTLSTANLYGNNRSKSGVTVPSGNGTKCRDYSITQVHGKGSTKGKLCVEIQSKVA